MPAFPDERPASSRPFSFQGHAPFAALAVLVAPLMFAFAWQPGLASMADDSISYLMLARHFAPGPSWADAWAWQHGQFPPLFPLVLWATGGASNLLVAHLLVAAFAVAALVFLYGYASWRLESRIAALCLVALFLAMPTAWISVKGILSEPMYLALTLAALWFHARRLEGAPAPASHWLFFGALLAAVVLTRSAGLTLVAAYAAHAAIRALGSRGRGAVTPLVLPAIPLVVAMVAWMLLRPDRGTGVRGDVVYMAQRWLDQGIALVPYAVEIFRQGWIASFQGQGTAAPLAEAMFLALLALGLAGAMWQAARNRLDGWYVILAVALVFAWSYPQDAARRLLYPLVPLLLLHAGELLLWLARPLDPKRRGRLVGVAGLAIAALCAPATVLLAERARDREPVPGTRYAYSDISNYYLYVNEALARERAGAHLATFAGFDAVAAATPPGARVMWVRPEYVALLSQREAVPYLNEWDGLALAREIRRTGAGYVIFAEMYKIDLNTTMRHPREVLADVPEYAREAVAIVNPVSHGREFVLYEVDRARLAEFIASREARGG